MYRLGDMLLELRDPDTPQQRVDEIARELNELGDREEHYRNILTVRGIIVENVETPDGSVRIAPGQFFLGNGVRPGEGYSGIRMEYPAFEMGGEEWNLAGVENDTLQFGVRASDGEALAGGGRIRLNTTGVNLDLGTDEEDTQVAVKWFDATDIQRSYIIGYATSIKNAVQMEAQPYTGKDSEIFVIGQSPAGKQGRVLLSSYEDSKSRASVGTQSPGPATISRAFMQASDSNVKTRAQLQVQHDTAGAEAIILTLFDGADNELIKFEVKGDTKRVAIGSDHYIPVNGASNPNVYFNEANHDMDVIIEGTTDGDLVHTDAGNDRVGIGTPTPTDKLDVNSDTIRLRTAKTPTSTSDASGNLGSIAWDDNYIYVKTSAGWKRAGLSTF